MNTAVICFSVVLGSVCGVLVWWLKRSLAMAILLPVVVVGLVVIALPPEIQPNAKSTDQMASNHQVPDIQEPTIQEPVPTSTQLAAFRPIEVADQGYVASNACLECHPENHASWYASYHRTMTQVAQPDQMLGDFRDVTLSQNGRDYHLTRADDVCWVEMMDPAAIPGTAAASLRVRRPVVMTTGSHHMQLYWFPIGVRRTLGLLPFAFLKETQEWIPRSAAFLNPGNDRVSHEIGRWNSACSKCHSTHRQEREITFGEWDTRAVEFGISCEACHGPDRSTSPTIVMRSEGITRLRGQTIRSSTRKIYRMFDPHRFADNATPS